MTISQIKICPICHAELSVEEFCKNIHRKDGLNYHCKSCEKKRIAVYMSRKENREASRVRASRYYHNNTDKCKEYQIKNKEHRSEYMARWRLERKEHIRKYKKKYHSMVESKSIDYRVLHSLRGRLRQAIKTNKKFSRAMELLGCDIPSLKKHIESKFSDGMTWENYGRRGWHIDHIIPCDAFDLSTVENQRKCFHYKNLQPLWWYDNCVKSNKIIRSS